MPKQTIIITVQSGCVAEVFSDTGKFPDIEVGVLDLDGDYRDEYQARIESLRTTHNQIHP